MIPLATSATVTASERLGAYHVLRIREFRIAQGARPGQFLNVVAGEEALLRRPFSVYLASPATGEVAIAFDPIGVGTRWLAARAPGDVIDVVGPLGVGFRVPPPDGGADLLVGGGYGTAALACLAEQLAARGRTVHAILGARSADRLFRDDVLQAVCASVTLTTDDGSAGRRGLVTDAMPETIARANVTTVFACGPNPMLGAVSRAAAQAGVACQVAVEEFMACGIGVCWTCVLPVARGGALKHERVCSEGPVFDGEVVEWASI